MRNNTPADLLTLLRFWFARKIRIVRNNRVNVGFPYHDNECHTRSRNANPDEPSPNRRDRECTTRKERFLLEFCAAPRCRVRRRIRLCSLEHRHILPALVPRAPAEARQCAVLCRARTGRTSGISRLPALPPKIGERRRAK